MRHNDEPAYPWDEKGPRGGMTLRDYFAAAALQGILASFADPQHRSKAHAQHPNGMPGATAEACYVMADAMLKARAE